MFIRFKSNSNIIIFFISKLIGLFCNNVREGQHLTLYLRRENLSTLKMDLQWLYKIRNCGFWTHFFFILIQIFGQKDSANFCSAFLVSDVRNRNAQVIKKTPFQMTFSFMFVFFNKNAKSLASNAKSENAAHLHTHTHTHNNHIDHVWAASISIVFYFFFSF